MWSPDVYEGAPTSFTAFLSVGPKAAGFAVLIRFLMTGLLYPSGDQFIDIKSIGIAEIISLLAVATMTVGNLVALMQDNIKRLLAYSSIAHAGYMLMGLAALSQNSIDAVMFLSDRLRHHESGGFSGRDHGGQSIWCRGSGRI